VGSQITLVQEDFMTADVFAALQDLGRRRLDPPSITSSCNGAPMVVAMYLLQDALYRLQPAIQRSVMTIQTVLFFRRPSAPPECPAPPTLLQPLTSAAMLTLSLPPPTTAARGRCGDGRWMRGGCRVATVRWPIEPPLGRAAPPAPGHGHSGQDEAGQGLGLPLRPRNDGARDGFWVYHDAATPPDGAGPPGIPQEAS
jgi:hypothetical protein